MGEQQGLEDASAEFTGWLSRAQLSMQQYRVVLMDLLAELFRFISSHQLNMEEIFGSSQDVYTKVLQLESAEALGSWLVKICRNLQKAVTFERQDTTKVFVQNAVEYVKEHYADQDLKVEVICKKLNVSSAYFSTIFKRESVPVTKISMYAQEKPAHPDGLFMLQFCAFFMRATSSIRIFALFL